MDDDLDYWIATNIMGLRSCDNWTPMNLGSAGGPALVHECETEDADLHFPTMQSGSLWGSVGGIPAYSTDPRLSYMLKAKLDELLHMVFPERSWNIARGGRPDSPVECHIWWPDPSKDDNSPGYNPHIDEVRVEGEDEMMAVALFAKALREKGIL